MPFNSLDTLQKNPFFFVSFGLLSFIIYVYVGYKSGLYFYFKRFVAFTLANVALYLSLLAFTLTSLTASTDETFLLASQVKNFTENGIPTVPTFGSKVGIQSSTELGIIFFASMFKLIFTFIDIESCLIIANLLLILFFSAAIQRRILNKNIEANLLSTLAIMTSIYVTPTFLNSIGSGMPVSSTSIGFAFISLVFFDARIHALPKEMRTVTLVALLTRWEYLVYALMISIYLVIYNRQFLSNTKKLQVCMVPAGALFLDVTSRKMIFGEYLPAAVIYKSAAAGYSSIPFGIEWLKKVEASTQYSLGILLIFAAAITFNRRNRTLKQASIVFIFSLIPIAQTIYAGGDWFSFNWGRFAGSTFMASFLIISFQIVTSRKERKVEMLSSIACLLAAVALMIWSSNSLGIIAYQFSENREFSRVDCLAASGNLIKKNFPREVGVMTAELNTISFFSEQPVYDLLGIANPRLVRTGSNPLRDGDLLHRVNHSNLPLYKTPGILYLYEGAYCKNDLHSSEFSWDDLTASEITKYRMFGIASYPSNFIRVELSSNQVTSLKLFVSPQTYRKFTELQNKN